MKKKNFYSLWAAALLMMAGGCSEELGEGDDPNGGGDGTGDKAYVTVRISSPSTGARTKAGDKPEGGEGNEHAQGTVDENYIKDVNIFLYKTTVQTDKADPDDNLSLNTDIVGCGYSDQVTNNEDQEHTGNHTPQATVEINIPKSTKTAYYNILTITNAGKKLTFDNVGQLRDYLFIEKAWEDGVPRDEKTVTTNFVMSTHTMSLGGDKSVVGLGPDKNTASVTVYVERLAARIDLRLGKDTQGKYTVAGTDNVELTAFSVVNQLKAGSYMFKRVTTPELGSDVEKQPIGAESDGDIYLGDEYWNRENKYNYVIDPWTRGKKVDLFKEGSYDQVPLASHYVDNGDAQTGLTPFNNLYINHFNKELNEKATFVTYGDLPNAEIGENEGSYGDKDYKLIAYTLENTTDWKEQLNGFSTGVIFKGTYTPKNVTTYKEESGENGSDTYVTGGFYTTKVTTTQSTQDDDVSTGTTTKTVLYANLKSLLVGSFSEGEQVKEVVKALFGEVETSSDVTKAEVRTVVNKLQGKFGDAYKTFVISKIGEDGDDDSAVTIAEINYVAFLDSLEDEDIDITDAEVLAEKYDIHYYQDGTCYYKYWIRHANNGHNPPNDPNMGIMEYGIVRNNLYKLDVTAIKKLGDPLPFTPGVDDPKNPNEDDKTQYYIEVEIYVKDWVVRDNGNIEL